MSVFCPKCHKQTYNEYICDYCQYEIKPNLLKGKDNKTFSIKSEFKRNPINVITALAASILAIVGIYFAYNKYQENQLADKLMIKAFGTDDYDKIINNQEKMMKKATKDYEKAMKQMRQQIQGIGK